MSHNPETKTSRTIKLTEGDSISVNRNQLNSSSSKMQYSIPKAQRFSQRRQNSLDESKFYDIPALFSKRFTTFGYGNKVDMSHQNFQKPPPTQYDLKGQFDFTDKKRGITISAGREVIKTNSAFQINSQIPGPGQYNHLENEYDKKKGYSLVSRKKDNSSKWIDSVPGPGNYETMELLKDNIKSMNSRIKSVRSSKFSQGSRKPQFEQRIHQNIPGPGAYIKEQKILDGITKFHDNHGYKFTHSQRQGITQKSKTNIPGPGSYNFFSEFVH